MTVKRFIRDYFLEITVDGRVIEITPPLKIVFSADKSIFGSLNKMNIQVYNLNRTNRLSLVKDAEEIKYIGVSLSVGYKRENGSEGNDSSLKESDLIFKGTVHTASNEKQGSDIITSMESLDGGYDFLNSYTSKSVGKGGDMVQAIIEDMPNTDTGVINKKDALTRPKVIVGNSIEQIQKMLNPDETWFIENEIINIIKIDELVNKNVTVVNAKTGMVSTPTRENKRITFQTKLNPSIKIGELAKIESVTAPHLDGVYRVDTIEYSGDNYGPDWDQLVTGVLFDG